MRDGSARINGQVFDNVGALQTFVTTAFGSALTCESFY
jgi:hypothetical protein